VAVDFGFSDPLDAPPNNFNSVKITTVPSPGSGTLTRMTGEGWAPVYPGQFVSVGDINAGKLKFTPARDAKGTAWFTFQVQDDGGTADGGVDLDSSPNRMTIVVAPITLTWVTTTAANCGVGESPEVTVKGNTATFGELGEGDSFENAQPNCIHGASAVLPPLVNGNTKYQVRFSYNLATWDSYNAQVDTSTGYWDSFSLSVSAAPYQDLGLLDPITTSNLPGLGFIFGGANYADSIQDTTSSEGTTAIMPVSGGSIFLNVVLDTRTEPQSNHAHPSYGTITILDVRQVP
jgi:hypothetical protein